MIYEIFGGRDTIIKNLMKQFDSDGDLLNANGVAGMDVTGKGTSWQKLSNVSEDHRQKMFDNVKREFIQEKGLSNGDTTKRSDIFKNYQLSVSKDKRLSGTWTLEQYEGQYRAAMYAAVKSANPNWKPGHAFDTSILDNVTRESGLLPFAEYSSFLEQAFHTPLRCEVPDNPMPYPALFSYHPSLYSPFFCTAPCPR